jgi:IclR family acetate operon transcriptional repressor
MNYMKTVDKALSVLDQFSLSQTEIGLSELSRMAGLDKAATRRLLVAMTKHGFIEQSQDTRKYRLGHGFLRLARIREATVPMAQAAQEAVDWLVQQTNETAHASIPGPHGMTSIAHKLPNRGHVINIVPAEILNFHATSSGLAYLAFAKDETVARVLALKRERVTKDTITGKAEILKALKQFRKDGFSQTRNTFEADVASMAMPFFQDDGDPAGSIALALPKAELTESRMQELLPLLVQAKAYIEKALTGH